MIEGNQKSHLQLAYCERKPPPAVHQRQLGFFAVLMVPNSWRLTNGRDVSSIGDKDGVYAGLLPTFV